MVEKMEPATYFIVLLFTRELSKWFWLDFEDDNSSFDSFKIFVKTGMLQLFPYFGQTVLNQAT